MKVVFSLGGSMVCPDDIDSDYIGKFSKFLKEICVKHKIYVVVGGGKTARKYVDVARKFEANEFFCDVIGIYATRLNACMLISSLNLNQIPFESIGDASKSNEKIVVMGGTHPMHTTDGVAAMLAENVRADLFINLTNVEYVYDKDPKKYLDAKTYEKLSYDELIKILNNSEMSASANNILDLVAAKTIKRSKIRTLILNGRNFENLKNAIEGEGFIGTVVE
ncbi:MAG: UMP kinase [Candidatus Altiarchaeales archaeon HGW-Altiarchaeales-1]|nr:MAG: UMP kinase [Candidatus Altiarchaeales archaeon HGW-Altiarchaeales-1]